MRPVAGPYDPARGRRVIAWARAFLDDVVPLAAGSHADAVGYTVVDGELEVALRRRSADGSGRRQAQLRRATAATPRRRARSCCAITVST